MDANAHKELIRATKRLRTLLGKARTSSVLRFCLSYNVRRARDEDFSGGLVSPARQQAFLVALLLATPEPDTPIDFEESDWEKCVELLDSIFRAYSAVMWPSPEELGDLSPEWLGAREVAGQALLHFHNTDLLATIPQVRDRIQAYLTPFDSVLRSGWGFSATEALTVCDWIASSWEDHEDELASAFEKERSHRLKLIADWEAQELTLDEFREHVGDTDYRAEVEVLFGLLDSIVTLTRSAIVERFGEVGSAFWEEFTLSRGSVDITYLTEANPFDTHPLVLLDDETAMGISLNSLYLGLLAAGELALEASDAAVSYRRARDKTLEAQVRATVEDLLGPEAEYYSEVYESADRQDEHDLVVITEGSVIVFESKASPPKEPFRDPEKGFVRLKRAFGSDRGIQKGYEQADRIRQRLAEGAVVQLYDRKGNEILRLQPDEISHAFAVCVTRDDFGPIAVDLALLLERPSTDHPYPWAVDVLSLQAIAEAWQYLALGPGEFIRFLTERRQLHGRTICWDELDVVGFFLKHGGLHWLIDSVADKMHITPYYSDLFDQIHSAASGAGPAVELEITEPFMGDVREMLGEMLSELASAKRNDPCPCGSGKKFKKCHGKAGG